MRRLSDNERLVLFILLFPPLWPLGLAWALSEFVQWIGRGIRKLWLKVKP